MNFEFKKNFEFKAIHFEFRVYFWVNKDKIWVYKLRFKYWTSFFKNGKNQGIIQDNSDLDFFEKLVKLLKWNEMWFYNFLIVRSIFVTVKNWTEKN